PQAMDDLMAELGATSRRVYGVIPSTEAVLRYFPTNLLYQLFGDLTQIMPSEYQHAMIGHLGDRYGKKFAEILQSDRPFSKGEVDSLTTAIIGDLNHLADTSFKANSFNTFSELRGFLETNKVAPWLSSLLLGTFAGCKNVHPHSTDRFQMIWNRKVLKISNAFQVNFRGIIFQALRDSLFMAVDRYWDLFQVPRPAGIGAVHSEVAEGLLIRSSSNPDLLENDIITGISVDQGANWYSALDILTHYDGLSDFSEFLRGEEGEVRFIEIRRGDFHYRTSTTLSKRSGAAATIDFAHRRDSIPFQPSNIVSLRGVDLNPETLREATDRIQKIKTSADQRLVLDLRGCPGGELPATIEFLSAFTDYDPIIIEDGGIEGRKEHKKEMVDFDFKNMEIVVLVDRQTASAAEIISGILQQNGATIVGTSKTYGKGSVQTPFLPEKSVFAPFFLKGEVGFRSFVKATTNKYFLLDLMIPVDGIGITPDILVDDIQDVNFDRVFAENLLAPPIMTPRLSNGSGKKCVDVF
ncbi:MAG: S41 family peptidase, partial [Pseudomonadota bacterium]